MFEVDHFPRSRGETLPAKSNLPSTTRDSSKPLARVDVDLKSSEEIGENVQYTIEEPVQETLSILQAKGQYSETTLIGVSNTPDSPSNLERNPNPELV